jgi:ribosomal protein L5
MNLLQTYNNKIIKNDLLNKFKIKNNRSLPQLKKITISFGCTGFLPVQKFATTLLAIEVICLKKGAISFAKRAAISTDVQKGQPTGCYVSMKKKEMFKFFTKLNVEIVPKLKNFSELKMNATKSKFSFTIPGNNLELSELQDLYPLFAKLPDVNIHVSVTNSREREKCAFIAKSLKIPMLVDAIG